MLINPFLKWAGGKRWLVNHPEFCLPPYKGRYIEPFLGGGAVFFRTQPAIATLSDINPRLIETYRMLKYNWKEIWNLLREHQKKHCKNYYYFQRNTMHTTECTRAAQFLYLNRACWNGLYRENLSGKFNVPIGTKSKILMDDDDFESVAIALEGADILCQDFEKTIDTAKSGDLIFADPPYTVAHNFNGFIKYNEKIFSWSDQIRLRDSLIRAASRDVKIIITNANHESIRNLYLKVGNIKEISRKSIISSNIKGRKTTEELLIVM